MDLLALANLKTSVEQFFLQNQTKKIFKYEQEKVEFISAGHLNFIVFPQ